MAPLFRHMSWLFVLGLLACGERAATPKGVAEAADATIDASPQDRADANNLEADAAPDDAHAPDIVDAVTPRAQRILFVGNSFVSVNDVPARYRALLGEVIPGTRVEQVAPGGYLLAQHARDARTDGTELARWLRTGTPRERAFDAFVLQEQSQMGGLIAKSKDRRDSIAATVELAQLATQAGALVVLYQTWGYERGDPSNTLAGFATYPSMQSALDEAYLGVVAMLREQSMPARLAPVGAGFRTIWEDVTRAGGDPLSPSSDFHALYEADGIHPSLRGAYLAACIIAMTITQLDAASLRDEPALGPDISRRLRDVCARVVVDPRWNVPEVVRAQATFEGDGAAFSSFGTTVTLSRDGTRLIIGEPRSAAASGGGTAWIYVRTHDRWGLETKWQDLARPSSAALNAGGTLAFLGPPIRLFRRVESTWQESTSWPQGASTALSMTGQLALSGDGVRALVGAPPGSTQQAGARVLVQRDAGWEEEASLLGTLADSASSPLAFDAEGERALVGSRVFKRQPDGWQLETTLPALGPVVALSGDGRRAAIASDEDNVVTVYKHDGVHWVEHQVLTGPHGTSFGRAIALNQDGTRLAVGHPFDTPVVTAAVGGDTTGSVHVYQLHAGTYRQDYLLVPNVLAESISPYDFGAALSLGDDGTVAVGAPRWQTQILHQGRAYTFALPRL